MARVDEWAGQGRYPMADGGEAWRHPMPDEREARRYPMTDGQEAGRHPMPDDREARRRPQRGSLGQRSRRRWAIAGGVAVCWLVLEVVTGSVLAATILLVVIAGLGLAGVAGLRAMGITRDHPWLRRLAARPWRDGQDVLHIATRHQTDVLVVTPHSSVFAPDLVELRMSPDDIASLREWMELEVVSISVTEVYEDQVARRGARFIGSCEPEVYILPDDSIPQGRYRLRRGVPASARYSPDPWGQPDGPDSWDQRGGAAPWGQPDGLDGPDLIDGQFARVAEGSAPTTADPVETGPGYLAWSPVNADRTIMDGMPTVMEQIRPAVPVLR
ncbi:MAG: hypothetical protein ACRDNZ_00010, partial [Streptosporangiaceae bacterium]